MSNAHSPPSLAETQWTLDTPIVTYWAGPSPITDMDAAQMRDGGWNLIWISHRGHDKATDELNYYTQQLNTASKYNLRAIVSIGKLIDRKSEKSLVEKDNPLRKRLTHIVTNLRNHEALYGYHIIDEPSIHLFDEIRDIKKLIHQLDPNALSYVNLYPIYASFKQLGVNGTSKLAAYRVYLESYLEIVKPQIISFDHYGLDKHSDKKTYFQNLHVVSELARASQIPFMVILQASSWTIGKRIPNGAELNWQMLTSRLYGANGISWYVYGYPGHDGGMIHLRNHTTKKSRSSPGGTPTALYYSATITNRLFYSISEILKDLTHLSVDHVGMLPYGIRNSTNSSPIRIEPNMQYKKLTNPVSGYAIGSFGTPYSKKATHFLILNLDYRTYSGRGNTRRNEFLKPIERFIVTRDNKECISIFNHSLGTWSTTSSSRVELSSRPASATLVKLSACN